MGIFEVFTLFGGLAFFLFGMNIMSSGLEQMAGGKLESMIRNLTQNKFNSVLLGIIVTVAIQSSSALTVMLVGLVNSGIMDLGQTIPVIMGSNIGTTFTTWITSLTGIQSENFWMQLLKPESFSPIIAFIGIVLVMICRSPKKKSIGSICLGFAVLMYGMTLMSTSVEPLKNDPSFQKIMTAFNNPILGVLVSTLFTGVIQSSAATIAILQTLSVGGALTFNMAMPLVLGANIGTCATALISSIGVNREAKRVAVVHVANKIIGTVLFLALFYGVNAIFDFGFTNSSIGPYGIAVTHTVFNVVCTVFFLPFCGLIEKMGYFLLPEHSHKEEYTFLDDRLLNTPSIAVGESEAQTVKMAAIAHDALTESFSLLDVYDEHKAEEVLKAEDEIDFYQDKLGSYLMKVSAMGLSEADAKRKFKILHTIDDFERLGDHAINILKSAKEIYQKDITFSDAAMREIGIIRSAVKEIIDMAFEAFKNNDVSLASNVEPLEQVIDRLIYKAKSHHVKRLQSGECTIQMGFVLSDLLNNFERISDHCSNIAVAVIEIEVGDFDTHQYLNEVRSSENTGFGEKYTEYRQKYVM